MKAHARRLVDRMDAQCRETRKPGELMGPEEAEAWGGEEPGRVGADLMLTMNLKHFIRLAIPMSPRIAAPLIRQTCCHLCLGRSRWRAREAPLAPHRPWCARRSGSEGPMNDATGPTEFGAGHA